jgi:hypothetical protein
MAFTLEVEFRGLCLYVVHPTTGQVAIVLPDGRAKPRPVVFADNVIGTPHVGFLSCRLEDVAGSSGAGGEVIHRFDSEQVEFGLPPAPAGKPKIEMPNADCFAPELQPVGGMFGARPPESVLMRMTLEGGQVDSTKGPNKWDFDGGQCGGNFADRVTWSRSVDAADVTLTFTNWNTGASSKLRLAPSQRDGAVKIRVANICSDNPLEWRELGVQKGIAAREDDDFRWFYQILESKTGSLTSLVGRTGGTLPVPRLDRRMLGGRSNPPGCEGCTITFAF